MSNEKVDLTEMLLEAHETGKLNTQALAHQEKVNSERMLGINNTLNVINKNMAAHQKKESDEWSKFYGRQWKVAGTIIFLLLSTLASIIWYIVTATPI